MDKSISILESIESNKIKVKTCDYTIVQSFDGFNHSVVYDNVDDVDLFWGTLLFDSNQV